MFAAHAYKTQVKQRLQSTMNKMDELDDINDELNRF